MAITINTANRAAQTRMPIPVVGVHLNNVNARMPQAILIALRSADFVVWVIPAKMLVCRNCRSLDQAAIMLLPHRRSVASIGAIWIPKGTILVSEDVDSL
jgi:hypothetical protein